MSAHVRATEGNFWGKGRKRRKPALPLAGDIAVDVAVVGAGYTGLSAAYELKRAEPSLNLAILEAEACGFGASGRNAGFVMTLFGSSLAAMVASHGAQRAREAHDYMVAAIDALEATIAEHKLKCDFERSGFLKVATTPGYVTRVEKELALLQSLGIGDIEWLEADAVAARIKSPTFLGGLWEPGCGLINPVKWVDGLRRLALKKGAQLYEGTRVERFARVGSRYRLATRRGTVTADKIVFATNGYTHLIPGLRSKQLPAFAYVIATAPLSNKQLAAIGWQGREGIEDASHFMHFYRLTPDNRILAGGGPGVVPFAGRLNHDASPSAWAHLERFIGTTFPAVAGIPITHRWGGAFSVTSDSTPQIATLDGGGAVYSLGCTGHGVAMTHMNGRIIRDLILGRTTELTQAWFVNRRSFPIPPEPFRSIGARFVMLTMALDDWWCDRSGRRL